MKFGRKCFVFIGLLLFAPLLLAHRTPEGLTTIERNSNTETIEITHRFYVHDAEHALQEILADPDLSFESLEGKAQLALHVESSFQLVDTEQEEPIPLALVGAEIDGDYILVFQEFAGELSDNLKIRHDALRDSITNQVNTVNITLRKQTRTLIFDGNLEWQELKW